MNLHDLANILRGDASPDKLLKSISAEVSAYREAFRKRGSSRPIYVTEDNFHFVVGRDEVKRLCSSFLNGVINEWELQYLANAIDLSSSFAIEDEEISEAISQLADPETNHPLNTVSVRGICERL